MDLCSCRLECPKCSNHLVPWQLGCCLCGRLKCLWARWNSDMILTISQISHKTPLKRPPHSTKPARRRKSNLKRLKRTMSPRCWCHLHHNCQLYISFPAVFHSVFMSASVINMSSFDPVWQCNWASRTSLGGLTVRRHLGHSLALL